MVGRDGGLTKKSVKVYTWEKRRVAWSVVLPSLFFPFTFLSFHVSTNALPIWYPSA